MGRLPFVLSIMGRPSGPGPYELRTLDLPRREPDASGLVAPDRVVADGEGLIRDAETGFGLVFNDDVLASVGRELEDPAAGGAPQSHSPSLS